MTRAYRRDYEVEANVEETFPSSTVCQRFQSRVYGSNYWFDLFMPMLI